LVGGAIAINLADPNKFLNSRRLYFRNHPACTPMLTSTGAIQAADILSVDISSNIVYIKPYQIQGTIAAGNCVCAGSASSLPPVPPTSPSSSSSSSASGCCKAEKRWLHGDKYNPNQTVDNIITVKI
jgi:hypothetical protein